VQKIFIDTFVVPEESKAAFLESGKKAQIFIKTLPGFVEGYLYEKKAGDGRVSYMTTAIWENEESFEKAKKAVAEEFQKRGFDPRESRRKLNIESERGVYERFPY
jgi:heme-degrading monooxygenase HmoA